MALNIKNPDVERLASELAAATGESKTEVIRQALLERKARLRYRVDESARRERVHRFLEEEVWSRIPAEQLGRPPGREEREAILGYASDGI
jgi:antitoxin VapB